MSILVGVSHQAITSGVFQDFTDEDSFHGETPKLAMFIVNNASELDQNTQHNVFSIGFANETGQAVVGGVLPEATLGKAQTRSRTNRMAYILPTGFQGSGPSAGEATTSGAGFIPNGIRLNWVENSGIAGHLATCILFGGSEFQSHVSEYYSGANKTETFAVSGMGFKPDVIMFVDKVVQSDLDISDFRFGIGCAAELPPWGFVSQGLAYTIADDTTTLDVGSEKTTSWIGGSSDVQGRNWVDGAISRVTSFSDDGFNGIRLVNDGNDGSIYAAMKFGTRKFWVGFYDLLPSGQQDYTGLDFKPQIIFGMGVPQLIGGMNASAGTNTGTLIVNVAHRKKQYCYNLAMLENSSPSQVSSRVTNKFFQFTTPSGTLATTGDFVKFLPDGFRVNNTLVQNSGIQQHVWGVMIQDKDHIIIT